jgi:hypothetical protein
MVLVREGTLKGLVREGPLTGLVREGTLKVFLLDRRNLRFNQSKHGSQYHPRAQRLYQFYPENEHRAMAVLTTPRTFGLSPTFWIVGPPCSPSSRMYMPKLFPMSEAANLLWRGMIYRETVRKWAPEACCWTMLDYDTFTDFKSVSSWEKMDWI